MAMLIFFLALFLFSDSDSLAQVYKYVDKKGAICFTDNPPSSLFKHGLSNKEQKSKELIPKKGSKSEVKDILQLGQEVLEEELAKPPEKQDGHLIQEMGEILYGDVSGRKSPQKIKKPGDGKVTIKINDPAKRAKEAPARQP
jgi:hypothetical protein